MSSGNQPDWAKIFERRPDLKPPGQEEAAAIVVERWANRPRTAKSKSSNKRRARWPSLKHGSE